MGPLGTQELIFIFVLALLLFGPKKLPELGRTIGKAMTEFRRAQSELKSTFDREMKNLERETGINELAATSYLSGSYDYDSSAYDPSYYEGTYVSSINPTDSTVTTTAAAINASATNGASAIQGAGAPATLQIEAAAGSIASGHLEVPYSGSNQTGSLQTIASSAPAEHGFAAAASPVIGTAASEAAHNPLHG